MHQWKNSENTMVSLIYDFYFMDNQDKIVVCFNLFIQNSLGYKLQGSEVR